MVYSMEGDYSSIKCFNLPGRLKHLNVYTSLKHVKTNKSIFGRNQGGNEISVIIVKCFNIPLKNDQIINKARLFEKHNLRIL